jgi:hypothetical protein
MTIKAKPAAAMATRPAEGLSSGQDDTSVNSHRFQACPYPDEQRALTIYTVSKWFSVEVMP